MRMPNPSPWSEAADALTEALGLTTPPIAITFSQAAPDGVSPFDAPMPGAEETVADLFWLACEP